MKKPNDYLNSQFNTFLGDYANQNSGLARVLQEQQQASQMMRPNINLEMTQKIIELQGIIGNLKAEMLDLKNKYNKENEKLLNLVNSLNIRLTKIENSKIII